MENEDRIIAVWGSPGAGKTTLSIKIAKELQAKKHSVAIILCNDETPALPILIPNGKLERRSLGELLSQPHISQAEILRYSVPFGSHGNIGLLGYCIDDNPMSYPEYSSASAHSLISALSRLVDFILVDCSSDLVGSTLTLAALEDADVTLRVVNADLRSIVYMRSQQPLLADSRIHFDQQIVVLNSVLPEQDENAYAAIISKADYILPHCPAVEEQYETGKLSESLFGREAKHYDLTLLQLVKDALNHEEH